MRYRVNHPKVINETIDGEAIMINLETGSYYSLDSIGGEIWELVEQSRTTDDIVAVMTGRYEAPDGMIRQAVEDLLGRLHQEQLVALDDDQTGSAWPLAEGAPGDGGRRPFTPPRLEKFTDMQDLILLDPVHEVDSRGWPHVADGASGS